MVRISTLLAVAGGGGVGIGVMALLLAGQKERFANQGGFVRSAIEIMGDQPAVVELLGGKFEVGRATFADGWSKMDNTQIRVQVPIKGEGDTAKLYAFARRKDKEDKYRLFKLEMTFDKVEGKKLILLDLDEPGDPLEEATKGGERLDAQDRKPVSVKDVAVQPPPPSPPQKQRQWQRHQQHQQQQQQKSGNPIGSAT